MTRGCDMEPGRRIAARGQCCLRPPRADEGWRVFTSMIAGMVLYGALGWLIGRWTGISILFPVGMLFGLVLSVLAIVFRFTRS
jgi:ATP synthase protein I